MGEYLSRLGIFLWECLPITIVGALLFACLDYVFFSSRIRNSIIWVFELIAYACVWLVVQFYVATRWVLLKIWSPFGFLYSKTNGFTTQILPQSLIQRITQNRMFEASLRGMWAGIGIALISFIWRIILFACRDSITFGHHELYLGTIGISLLIVAGAYRKALVERKIIRPTTLLVIFPLGLAFGSFAEFIGPASVQFYGLVVLLSLYYYFKVPFEHQTKIAT